MKGSVQTLEIDATDVVVPRKKWHVSTCYFVAHGLDLLVKANANLPRKRTGRNVVLQVQKGLLMWESQHLLFWGDKRMRPQNIRTHGQNSPRSKGPVCRRYWSSSTPVYEHCFFICVRKFWLQQNENYKIAEISQDSDLFPPASVQPEGHERSLNVLLGNRRGPETLWKRAPSCSISDSR